MEKLNTNFFKKDDKSKLIIYHGSNELKGLPVFGKGKKINDYGLGFYCTEDLEKAKLWSVMNNTDGFVNKYELNVEGLKILRLDDSNILQWLAILASNRLLDLKESDIYRKLFIDKYLDICIDDYDCIEGYRADDSYFYIAKGFFNGRFCIEDLNELLHLGNLGRQFVLKSKKAFGKLEFVSCYNVNKLNYYNKYSKIDSEARIMARKISEVSGFREHRTLIYDLIR